MLDTETKGRIDSARDILVGKVPDPKSQVEQITIALIYKFMDDMDRQSEELGGKATFFAGEFKKYRWANLLDKRLGGHERLILYAEGIEKMNVNKNIPQLFRDIFKGVFLPYRDPETLNLFLKEVNGFTYDHSERLGDAFEYLLSVLGTQGDAGQFRTPRHIIDFIVAVVDPKKNETVLDPACGTAGFLISAFKHILKGNENLTPDERARLMTNFRGYDIAPDMVRLSRANLYLHGFPNPVIHEYDTLTSEERWDERCDVIMANPPFMSPKGGIRPHNRFSIKAKRSEVLFVDYIAEHLNPSGRAGIIVPEGIIFQSQNAYKQLRKMLVDNYLWAVVSLPAGVFNPYAGVKTSVLFLDRNLAKRTDEVLFVKVESDGFDLGAQRRPNGKNDLPEALKILDSYRTAQKTQENKMALTVSRKYLLESGDVNLSGDRYRETIAVPSKWPMVKIGELCDLQNGRAFKPVDWEKAEGGGLPIIRIQNLNNSDAEFNYYSSKVDARLIVHRGDLLFSWSGSRGTSFGPHIWNGTDAILNQHIFNVRHGERVDRLFFYWMLKKAVEQVEENLHGGVGLVHITKGNLERIEIPLPPLEVQKEIVAEIEDCQKVINGARAVLDNYRPHIPIHPDWPMVEFSDVVFFQEGPGVRNWQFTSSGIKLLNVKNIVGNEIVLDNSDKHISTEEFAAKYSHFLVEDGDIILASSGATYGKNAVFKDPGFPVMVNTSNIRLHTKDAALILQGYIKTFLDSPLFKTQIDRLITGSAQPNFGPSHLKQIKIPLPPLATQQAIVAEIEAEQALVAANRELITRFEKKIHATLARIWGEEGVKE